MTPHLTATAASRPRIPGLVRAAARTLSGHAHGAADDRARAAGWTVTETPGRLGLTGRSYHDPRFTARQHPRAATGRDGRRD